MWRRVHLVCMRIQLVNVSCHRRASPEAPVRHGAVAACAPYLTVFDACKEQGRSAPACVFASPNTTMMAEISQLDQTWIEAARSLLEAAPSPRQTTPKLLDAAPNSVELANLFEVSGVVHMRPCLQGASNSPLSGALEQTSLRRNAQGAVALTQSPSDRRERRERRINMSERD